MSYWRSQLPNIIYLIGSMSFFVGTAINMWRAR